MAFEPIDREPTILGTASAPIDRGFAADRSAKARHAERRRFSDFYDSEFPPKLGQITCSINRTHFGRKEEVHTERNTTRSSRTPREDFALQKEDEDGFAYKLRLSFLYSFISFLLYFL